MNFIQRQLQTAVNNITQWCNNNGFAISTSKTAGVHFCRKRNLHNDPEIKLYGELITFVNEIRFLGVIFDKKLSFLPHVKQLRKKCESALNILKVLSTTAWGADRVSMLKIYRATVLSKLEYGCTIYGSARKSVLQKLDPVHHTALRLCSGAFRTSPVKSLYVECCEPALELKRQMLSLHYYFKIQSNSNHPFHDFKLRPFLIRLQNARKSFIPVFFTRVQDILNDLNLLHLHVTPEPKIFTAEIAAVLLALEQISDFLERKFIIYTDSLSVLESLKSFYINSHHHPLVLNVLHLLNKLASRDFNILLCWVPSHVGIVGNEEADKAAKLASTQTNSTVPLTYFKKYTKFLFYTKWQRQWDTETDNKLHSVKPHVQPWPSLTTRKADTLLTRLRVGHTRYTHRHLLFGEQTPMCSQCNCIPDDRGPPDDHWRLLCPSEWMFTPKRFPADHLPDRHDGLSGRAWKPHGRSETSPLGSIRCAHLSAVVGPDPGTGRPDFRLPAGVGPKTPPPTCSLLPGPHRDPAQP
ncbi:hypothetical protein AVEN_180334-1 [Araneus ventricosus]|uniref:RNase H type-1 domain-containing protein n=1 Tax=Araneus ventricosus TaxID=182803 RepID=A0A4Y2UYU8_ARAVE|nr:hypothetical protein AVEN_180334-1 [Araneus ventricosus]